MSPELQPEVVLARPDLLSFPSNRTDMRERGIAQGAVSRTPTGHLIYYGSHGRRILATDPAGQPLHECEWEAGDGGLRLVRARVRLDWGQWVGLVPSGLVNATTLDLSRKPAWQRVGVDDLRVMAAQALRVPMDEVRFFYTDRDVTISPAGLATIRQRKDAIYVLPNGTFDSRIFMACMGAMHWEQIDFLPVVELFLSLLPGTGSAILELIRGLYDDQQRNAPAPRPLRYRGIPTYPSAAAYRLFGGFFRPQVPGGGDPFPLFMDPPKSHLVTWLPADDAPRRCWDPANSLCVTIQGGRIVKATVAEDSAGLSYLAPDPPGTAPCERALAVQQGFLVLRDRDLQRSVPLDPGWGPISETGSSSVPLAAYGWRSVFEKPPAVSAKDAFSAVLLYPEDEREIGELATQPFVADYVQDLLEQEPHVGHIVARAERVLISRFDASITTCIGSDRARSYTVWYDHPAYAQRQAQALWNAWSRTGRLAWLSQVRMRESSAGEGQAGELYDVVYDWMPFSLYSTREGIVAHLRGLAQRLSRGAVGFVAGPPSVPELCSAVGLQVQTRVAVETLPTFRMHRTILPNASLKPGVMLYYVMRR